MEKVIKSKFIDGIYYIEIPEYILEASKGTFDYPSWYEDMDNFFGKKIVILYGKSGTLTYEIDLPKINNYEGLFLTKLATEEDWKKLVGYVSSESVYRNYIGLLDDAWNCIKPSESGLSLLKAEKLDVNKNYLIVKSEDYSI